MFERFFLERKMDSPFFKWTAIFVLTLLLYYSAQLGGQFGIQGLALDFSLIWPAAGISLAAVLLFGFHVIPGIFLGNFLYNFLELQTFNASLLENITAASFVALGSTLQAAIGGTIIRRYSSYEYFGGLRDVLIFLIPAGLLTCIVGSSIGNFTLYFYGGLHGKDFWYTLITFWLGDLMGVYVFTSLIVIWVLDKPKVPIKRHLGEGAAILLLFVLVSYLTFFQNFSLTHLYLPLCIWGTFHFFFHGATTLVFLTSTLTVVLTSLGYGPFVPNASVVNPLLFLVSFLEVNIATALLLAAVLKEREQAKLVIERSNLDLQEEIHEKLEEIQEIYYEIFLKERMATVGKKTTEVTRQILLFLSQIKDFALKGAGSCQHLEERLLTKVSQIPEDVQVIDHSFSLILQAEKEAHHIAETILNHIDMTSDDKIDIKTVNIHHLLDKRLGEIQKKYQERDELTNLVVERNYDPRVASITGLPWELAFSFDQLLDRMFHSMTEKQRIMEGEYIPKLTIATKATFNGLDIVMHDNGKGASRKDLESFFHPFAEESEERKEDLGLSLAFDIIVKLHHGNILVSSEEGQYLKMTVKLLEEVHHGIFRLRKDKDRILPVPTEEA